MKGKEGKIAVIVGSLLNDTRVEALPKGLRVCALRFSDKAAQRIKQAGGETLTFDQLALIAPKGQKTVLLRGKLHSREVCRHWGAPGVPGSHAKPKLGNRKANLRGRKHQRARGRRNSKAWKVSK
jgi:large subunit ribosomal protein L18e